MTEHIFIFLSGSALSSPPKCILQHLASIRMGNFSLTRLFFQKWQAIFLRSPHNFKSIIPKMPCMKINMSRRLFERLSCPSLFLIVINYEGICEVKDKKNIVGGTDFFFIKEGLSKYNMQNFVQLPTKYYVTPANDLLGTILSSILLKVRLSVCLSDSSWDPQDGKSRLILKGKSN